jgi:thiol:disulfide interchange protein
MVRRHVKASLAALFAFIVAAVLAAVGFGLLPGAGNSDRFPWRDYSPELMTQLRSERKPILIHFVADWDLVIHLLRRLVIELPEVRAVVERHGYTCVSVDCTGLSRDPPGPPVPPIWKDIESLGIGQIPVTVVFPVDEKRPVVFVGHFTKERLIAALNGEG